MQCPTCGAQVEEGEEICPECGMDLMTAVSAGAQQSEQQQEAGVSTPAPQQISTPAPPSPTPIPSQQVTTTGSAMLTLKRAGAMTSEVFNVGERVNIGRFDAETGPVDVDLGPLPEAMYISRQHSEIYRNQEGKWMIRDLGSANGTFVRNIETGRFDRIQGDVEIEDGDEIAFGNASFIFNVR